MSDSDTDEEDIPNAEVCDSLCKNFADITETDTALAMFYLQKRKWDLQLALDVYCNEIASQPSSTDAVPEKVDDAKPRRIRLLSWNIDGLDTANLQSRTESVCRTICSENADIVFLQEVVPRSVIIIEQMCAAYHLITAGDEGYFTAILLKCDTVDYVDHEVKPFFSSTMGRSLLVSRVKVAGISCLLVNSHLESTASHSEERTKQLKTAFNLMKDTPTESTVIFGGDLNLRDKELAAIGGLPTNISDLWEQTGKRPEARYTWDSARNDNTTIPGRFRPRCRFDRIYMRHSTALKAVYFELVGLERLPACRRFPSDHWGLLVHFDVV